MRGSRARVRDRQVYKYAYRSDSLDWGFLPLNSITLCDLCCSHDVVVSSDRAGLSRCNCQLCQLRVSLSTFSQGNPSSKCACAFYHLCPHRIQHPHGVCGGTASSSISTIQFCQVALNVTISDKSQFFMEAWLPSNYTGRFLSTGNGGLNGCSCRFSHLGHVY